MKRISVCIIILIALVTLSISGLLHIKSCTEDISVQLDDIINAVREEDYDTAVQTAEAIKDYWEHNTVFTFAYINQDRIMSVTSSLAKIIGLSEEESEEVIAECLMLKTYLSLMYHTELPILENIL